MQLTGALQGLFHQATSTKATPSEIVLRKRTQSVYTPTRPPLFDLGGNVAVRGSDPRFLHVTHVLTTSRQKGRRTTITHRVVPEAVYRGAIIGQPIPH